MTTTMNLHAHMSTSSSDCDGPQHHEHVVGITEAEAASDFAEIEFRERVIASLMSVTGMGGTLTTTCEPGEWISRAEWRETTEEGYRSGEARFCEDDYCDPNAESHRDVFAEMMGY